MGSFCFENVFANLEKSAWKWYNCVMEKTKILAELKRLLACTQSLSEPKKGAYLEAIKYLPTERLVELQRILQEEADAVARIDAEQIEATSKINKGYLEDSEKLVKESEKEFIAVEEKSERAEGEKMLEKLNDI